MKSVEYVHRYLAGDAKSSLKIGWRICRIERKVDGVETVGKLLSDYFDVGSASWIRSAMAACLRYIVLRRIQEVKGENV